MKKGMLLAALLLLAGGAVAQELKKGNLVGTHVISVKLEPGVTMDQYAALYREKVVPEFEKVTGWRIYPVKRIRGEKVDGLGVIMVVPSEAERDKFFNADGTPNELHKSVTAKVQGVLDELNKLGTITSDVYTDWLVY